MNQLTRKFTTSERLKTLMSERQLKQVDILKMLKPYETKLGLSLSKSLLSMYVNGKSTPNQNGIYLLAKAFDVNEGWLMGFDVPMDRPANLEFENTAPTAVAQKIMNITNQLKPQRQEVVYCVAKSELKAQQNETMEIANEFVTFEHEGVRQSYPKNVVDHIVKTSLLPRYSSLEMSAGVDSWSEAVDPPEMWDIPVSLLKYGVEFCAPINGESMQPNYPNGAEALIKPLTDWNDGIGKVCAVWHEGGAYIKEIGDAKLISHNKVLNKKTGKRVYPDIDIHDFSETHIIGEVMGVYDQKKINEY